MKAGTGLNRWLYLMILGMAFAIPLFFNPAAFYRYELDKIFIFRLIVGLMLALWLISKLRLAHVWSWLIDKAARLSLFDVEVWQLMFIAIYGLATIFSISPMESFWGMADREFGFVTVVSFILFFWLGVGAFQRVTQVKTLATTIISAGFLVSVYAVCQKFGWEFIPGVHSETLSHSRDVLRPISTLGNPNYLSAYLAMILPFTLFVYTVAKRYWTQAFVLLVVLAELAALYFTLSRGGWLAAAAGVIVFLFFYAIKIQVKVRVVIVSVVILVFIGSFFTGILGLGGDKRTQDLTFEGGSMYVRLQDYKFALRKIMERPILGYGPETYAYLSMSRVYTEKEMMIDNRLSDRAHNIFLDTLVNVGLLGFAAWIFIFGKTFFRAGKKVFCHAEESTRLVQITAASSLAAYLTEVQFHFDTVVTSFFVLINFCLIYANLSQDYSGKDIDFTGKKVTVPIWILTGAIMGIILYLNLGAFIWNATCCR